MKKIINLTLQDMKNIYREPMLIMSMLAPIIILLLINLFVPWLNIFLANKWSIKLDNYYELIISIFLTITPFIIGVLGGLLILDEKEENMIIAYLVSPLGKKGYVIYRLLMPVVMSFIFMLIIMIYVNIYDINILKSIPIVFLASLEAPIISLFMSSFGNNKVEGLTLTKIIGIIILLPILDYVLDNKYTKLAGIFPNFWVSNSFLNSSENAKIYLIYVMVGIIISVIYISLLFKKFSKLN